MLPITRITPETIDIEISNVVSGNSLRLSLNEYEFRTLQLEFARGLRPFDKVKYVVNNSEGTILQDGSCSLHHGKFALADEIALEIFMLKNQRYRDAKNESELNALENQSPEC